MSIELSVSHPQQVTDELRPRLDDIGNQQARSVGIAGLRVTDEGPAARPHESMKGVTQVLESFAQMRQLSL